jgi:hypothetical protein
MSTGRSPQDPDALARHFLDDVLLNLRKSKRLADDALAQVDDERFFAAPDPDSNSLALIVKHVAGNQRSRWTDFLSTDGEKPDRDRDSEFELGAGDTRADLMARWETGWTLVLETLGALQPGELLRTVTVRGEAHTALQAIERQLVHYAHHAGQIVFLAKLWAGPSWRTLSIPRGASKRFEVAKDGVPYRTDRPPGATPHEP